MSAIHSKLTCPCLSECTDSPMRVFHLNNDSPHASHTNCIRPWLELSKEERGECPTCALINDHLKLPQVLSKAAINHREAVLNFNEKQGKLDWLQKEISRIEADISTLTDKETTYNSTQTSLQQQLTTAIKARALAKFDLLNTQGQLAILQEEQNYLISVKQHLSELRAESKKNPINKTSSTSSSQSTQDPVIQFLSELTCCNTKTEVEESTQNLFIIYASYGDITQIQELLKKDPNISVTTREKAISTYIRQKAFNKR